MISWSWQFLTERLHMPKDRLYVSYFGGDKQKGLEPDNEARDYWLQLGYGQLGYGQLGYGQLGYGQLGYGQHVAS